MLLAGLAWFTSVSRATPGSPIGLFTTLPILWDEAADVAEIIRQPAEPHWARSALATHGRIVPLDTLAGPAGHAPLAPLKRLVIAQPRPLAPSENVALDDWVRHGGRLLLFADPALTEESRFAVGDPRRPEAVVLLSPILRRWGLELQFDDRQPFGERTIEVAGAAIPVNLPGRFVLVQQGGSCRVEDEGLLADCRIGRGKVVALADAALLERNGDADARVRRKAFDAVFERAFAGR